MNFHIAVQNYLNDKTKGNLARQVDALVAEMTDKEKIRMLSNLETETEKLIQIILLGQPELRRKLNSPKLEQFSQRIVFYYNLEPLDRKETEEYISFRLEKAGSENPRLFATGAVDTIYEYSNGVPRLINLACHNALINGVVCDSKKKITGEITQESVDELMHNGMHNRRLTMLQRAYERVFETAASVVSG